MTLTERLWRMLPDRCQCIDCARRGVRGNENRVGGKIVCDYCYASNKHLDFNMIGTNWWDRHPRLRWPTAILAVIYFLFFLTAPLHPWMPQSVRWW